MFGKGIRLPFKLAGIPLYLDFSFLIIFPLMVWMTAANLRALVHSPQFGLELDPASFTPLIALLLGLFTVVGLFASVILHELGHSLVARRYGVRVRRITLWFLGGVAEFEEMPRQRGAEAVVAIAGPIVSFVLAGIFFALGLFTPQNLPTLWLVAWYLTIINLMLGAFNLLPAMPMDGGRILRSLLALKLSYARATAISANVARVIAVLMGAWALIGGNLWLIVLAVFIFAAARRESISTIVTDLLKGLRVSDIMSRDVPSVPASMSLGELGNVLFTTRNNGFPVVDDAGKLIGTVGVEQLRKGDPHTAIWQVMSTDILGISQDAPALDALGRMLNSNADRLIVLDQLGIMSGIITRADIERVLQVRMTGFQTVEPRYSGPYIGHRPLYAPAVPPGYTPQHAPGDSQRHARSL